MPLLDRRYTQRQHEHHDQERSQFTKLQHIP